MAGKFTPDSLVAAFEAAGLTEENLAAWLGTEVRNIDAKIATVRAEHAKVQEAFEAQLAELSALRADAQKRADEALGKA